MPPLVEKILLELLGSAGFGANKVARVFAPSLDRYWKQLKKIERARRHEEAGGNYYLKESTNFFSQAWEKTVGKELRTDLDRSWLLLGSGVQQKKSLSRRQTTWGRALADTPKQLSDALFRAMQTLRDQKTFAGLTEPQKMMKTVLKAPSQLTGADVHTMDEGEINYRSGARINVNFVQIVINVETWPRAKELFWFAGSCRLRQVVPGGGGGTEEDKTKAADINLRVSLPDCSTMSPLTTVEIHLLQAEVGSIGKGTAEEQQHMDQVLAKYRKERSKLEDMEALGAG